MRSKVFKIGIILAIILTMTMSNFVFVGSSLVSYALSNNSETNNKNIEFNSYFKNEKEEQVSNLDMVASDAENMLYISLNVKQEGYLNNATINLEDGANFKIVGVDSQYVDSVENNTINLHTITAGTYVEIPVKIEPVKEDQFNTGLLSVESKITINGIYRDSSEKDKKIKATKKVQLNLIDGINETQDIINDANIITNKILNINGENKRVVQLRWNIGLKNHTYPINEIVAKVKIPVIKNEVPEVEQQVYLNTMTSHTEKNENNTLEITLKNDETQGNVKWNKQGTESILITYIYSEETDISKFSIQPEMKMTLYNKKEITAQTQVINALEEKDETIGIYSNNQENEIYKGKIVSGIERNYQTTTAIQVNLAKAIDEINVQENPSVYQVGEAQQEANIFYTNTIISKTEFDAVLGNDGNLVIMNNENQEIANINSNSEVNENGYFVINYQDGIKAIKIKTSKPIAEGTISLISNKKIQETQQEIAKNATNIKTTINYKYNQAKEQQIENTINLKDTITESKIEVNKEQLSTILDNSVEMKVTLLSNDEKYDLYKNPNLSITLPEQVENVEVTKVSKLFDDNNEFNNSQYSVDGRTINISLGGTQTNYITAVEGITIVIEAQLKVNKFSATSDEQIYMTYNNENAVSYVNDGTATAPIRIMAPRDITTVNSIKELSVETTGEDQETQVMMEKGADSKQVEAQMEVINSNPNAINNVKILGNLPTNNSQNNMGIAISEGIKVEGTENAKIYYSKNENATDEIEKAENEWTENLNNEETKKFLILVDNVETQSNLKASYKMTVPENLEYNKEATEGYTIKSTNSGTGVENEVKATNIAMETGVGPRVEAKVEAIVGADKLDENAKVKNGEVIKYQIQVSNTGTEDVSEVKVIGQVPQGTEMVTPMKDFEYSGSQYYQVTDNANYEKTLQDLKIGETKTVEYEVRVKSDLAEGTNIVNNTEIQYGEVKTTNTITNKSETGDIRISLKRVSDISEEKTYIGNFIDYFAIIENTSNKELKNIKFNVNLSNNAEIASAELITGMTVDLNDNTELPELETEELDINNMTIKNIQAGETKVIGFIVSTKYVEGNTDKITLQANANHNNKNYRSNSWEDKMLHYNLTMAMHSNIESQTVKTGDEIKYIIDVTNTENALARGIYVKDEIPEDLSIESIKVNGQEEEIPETDNTVNIICDVNENSTTTIEIATYVDYHENQEAKQITNKAQIIDENDEEKSIAEAELTYVLEAYNIQSREGNENPGEEEPGGENPTTPGANGNMILGTAWNDKNSNGKKETEEPLLSNVNVKLLDAQTNQFAKNSQGIEITAITNESGIYTLQDIPNGKYIAIFEYDTSKYGLTKYQVNGVTESENSNVIMNDVNINGNTSKVAATDILTINDNNVSNINIGLIDLKDFNLKLDKYVNRILIQDSTGTTVREYGNANMAKAELDAKKIEGSTVIIEYNIVVSNIGEIEGYAKKIVDYMPNDLHFSSELNKEWYQSEGALYNASLANEKIAAGDTKTVNLTLTKSMTEDNTGNTINTAEIAEDYNELGIADSNSTPDNRKQNEDDISSAEIILSIRTGGFVYASLIIVVVAICAVIAFIIIKNRQDTDVDIHKII